MTDTLGERHRHVWTIGKDGVKRCACGRKSTDRTTVVVTAETRENLQALKRELGFRNLAALFNYAVLELTKEGLIPPAEYSVVFERREVKDGETQTVPDTRPVLITGESGAGKTTAVRELLSKWKGSAFVLDVRGDEYPELKRIDLGKVFSMDWERENQRMRFVPNSNPQAALGEASAIFGHLNYLKNAGVLKNWVIVVEEGHRFNEDANLRTLLIEGRKFARKVILITADWRIFQGIARVFKPRPWELSQEGAASFGEAPSSSYQDPN